VALFALAQSGWDGTKLMLQGYAYPRCYSTEIQQHEQGEYLREAVIADDSKIYRADLIRDFYGLYECPFSLYSCIPKCLGSIATVISPS
jgi:hypothetical protein